MNWNGASSFAYLDELGHAASFPRPAGIRESITRGPPPLRFVNRRRACARGLAHGLAEVLGGHTA